MKQSGPMTTLKKEQPMILCGVWLRFLTRDIGQWGLKEALMKNDLLCTILGGPPVSSFQKR